MITFVLVFIAGALIAALSGVIGDEARGWLELAPRGILWLVARRLPADLRKTVYKEEWLPELLAILQEADGRPITRLVVGAKFAVSMARGAGHVARELDGVRKHEGEIVIHLPAATTDEFAAGLSATAAMTSLAEDDEGAISAAANLMVILTPGDDADHAARSGI